MKKKYIFHGFTENVYGIVKKYKEEILKFLEIYNNIFYII